MTPISPKDRPKVIALGVLSVGMLGFFLMSVMGAIAKKNPGQAPSNPPPPAALAPLPAPSGPVATASIGQPGAKIVPPEAGLPTGGTTEPFRHVLPDPAALQRMIAEAAHPSGNKPMSLKPLSGTIGGTLPPPGGAPAVGPGGQIQAVIPPDPTLRLDGVVSDHDRYAMVTFRDRTDMYHIGSRIAGMITVIGVTNSGASFRGPNGVFRMDVGDEHSATAPPEKQAPGTAAPAANAKPGAAKPAEPKTTSSKAVGSTASHWATVTEVAPAHRKYAKVNRSGRTDLGQRDLAEYAAIPLPAVEGPAAGRGH